MHSTHLDPHASFVYYPRMQEKMGLFQGFFFSIKLSYGHGGHAGHAVELF